MHVIGFLKSKHCVQSGTGVRQFTACAGCVCRLAPGEQWKGEYVVRYHEQYWDPPVFDGDAAQPMPKLVTQRDDADDR